MRRRGQIPKGRAVDVAILAIAMILTTPRVKTTRRVVRK